MIVSIIVFSCFNQNKQTQKYTLCISGVLFPLERGFVDSDIFCVDGILKHNKVLLKINEYMAHVYPLSKAEEPQAALTLI